MRCWPTAEVLAVAEEWGPVDRSHRKLAHRGSYVGRVWVAPSTFRRVLAAHGLVLPEQPPTPRRPKTPWPHWLVWEPNRIWIWDVTHFGRARRCVFAIVDMVSRYWITTLVSTEETSTQVRVIFDQALLAQDLDELLTDDRLDLDIDDPDRPILLAVSDNGPAMTSHDTRAYRSPQPNPAAPQPTTTAQPSPRHRHTNRLTQQSPRHIAGAPERSAACALRVRS